MRLAQLPEQGRGVEHQEGSEGQQIAHELDVETAGGQEKGQGPGKKNEGGITLRGNGQLSAPDPVLKRRGGIADALPDGPGETGEGKQAQEPAHAPTELHLDGIEVGPGAGVLAGETQIELTANHGTLGENVLQVAGAPIEGGNGQGAKVPGGCDHFTAKIEDGEGIGDEEDEQGDKG